MDQSKTISWREEYEELMFGPSRTEKTISRAVEIKNEHMPELLFKYRQCSENSFDALERDYLFSSQPSEFNDIFEGAIEISSADAKSNLYQKTYKRLRNTYPQLIDTPTYSYQDLMKNIAISLDGSYQDIEQNHPLFPVMETLGHMTEQKHSEVIKSIQRYARNMYNICCFSDSYDNETMWAYYADSHKGFCVGYDIKGLNNDMTELTLPVLYKKDCSLCVDDLDELNSSDCMHMLTVKTQKWNHEREWRTFFKATPPKNRENMPCAKVVYLGANIFSEHEQKLKIICEQKKIKVYKMHLQIAEHRLVPTLI